MNILNISKLLFQRFIPAALLLMASAGLYAQPSTSIELTGSEEVPPVTTSGSGSGQISVLEDHTVNGSVNVSDFVATGAHIHEGAAGTNGPAIIPLKALPDGKFVVPTGTRLTDAQFTSYLNGNLYINVHSASHPNGEVRAQLSPPAGEAEESMPAKY